MKCLLFFTLKARCGTTSTRRHERARCSAESLRRCGGQGLAALIYVRKHLSGIGGPGFVKISELAKSRPPESKRRRAAPIWRNGRGQVAVKRPGMQLSE